MDLFMTRYLVRQIRLSSPIPITILASRRHGNNLLRSHEVNMNPLFDPADFRLAPGVVHVCAGGETAALRSHDQALLRYVADKSAGLPGRTAQEIEVESARAHLARLWGVPAGDIGFV